MRSHTLARPCAFALALFGGLCCWAHDGPEHDIAELTEQIKIQGPSPDLLIQRATEYKVLGNFSEAAKDLEHALDLDLSPSPPAGS